MVRILEEGGPDIDDRLAAFMCCDIKPTLFVDRTFLEQQGMFEAVEQALAATGWESFARLSSETNEEDTREFLASVEPLTESRLMYRHRGTWYVARSGDLRAAFGYERAPEEERDTHSNREAWSVLTGGEHYVSGKCNASAILEPRFFYLHRVISRSITGRHAGTHKPSVADMDILRGLLYERKVQYSQVLAHHWLTIRPTSDIYVGGLITYYLRRTHGGEPLPHHRITAPEFLTRDRLSRMKAVRTDRTRGVIWSYRRVRGPPAEEDIEEEHLPQEQPPQQQQFLRRHTGRQVRAPSGPPLGADELTWMFNASRVFDYIAP